MKDYKNNIEFTKMVDYTDFRFLDRRDHKSNIEFTKMVDYTDFRLLDRRDHKGTWVPLKGGIIRITLNSLKWLIIQILDY